MTRLPTLTSRKVTQALERAGFVVIRQTGSHMILEHPTKHLTTCIPSHGGDLKRSLMKLILKQAGLTEDEFRKLM